MAWKQGIIGWIIEQFCNPSDSVEAKRRQCILVGTNFISGFSFLLTFIHTIIMGTFFKTYVNWLMVACFLAVLGHCKYTRTPKSARLVYVTVLTYQFFLLSQRGGFMFMSHLAILGLITPILSLFLSTSSVEPAIWFLLYFIGNAIIHFLQIENLLPPTAAPDKYLTWLNALSALYTAIIFSAVFWFVVHVYTTEVETRQLLQKDLQLFMRLSHEVRTPMTTILGMAELMKDWALTSDQKQHFFDFATATRRLTVVVNDLLTFSSSGNNAAAGNTDDPNEVENFNLREAMDTAVGYHLPKAEAAGLRVYIDFPSEVPMEVSGARHRLLCVLDHLIDNAVKFTPAGSITIQVELPSSTETETVPDPAMSSAPFRFIVRDTGVGIASDELPRIFQPFHQTEEGSARPFDGMGLGLTLVEQMVKRWGSSVTVTSGGYGQGSTFAFLACFAVRRSSPFAQDTTSRLSCCSLGITSAFSSNPTVLILDDDPFSAKSLIQQCAVLSLSVTHHPYGSAFAPDQQQMRDFDAVILSVGGRSFLGDPSSAISPASARSSAPFDALLTSSLMDVLHEMAQMPSISVMVVAAPPTLRASLGASIRSDLIRWVGNPPTWMEMKSALAPLLDRTFISSRSAFLPPLSPQANTGSQNSSGHVRSGPPTILSVLLDSTSESPSFTPPGATRASSLGALCPQPLCLTSSQTFSVPGDLPPPPPHSIELSLDVEQKSSASSSAHTSGFSSRGGLDEHSFTDPATPQPLPLLEATSALRILTVDDSPAVLRLLNAFVRKAGFLGTIDSADNGEKALEFIHEHRYLLIFMDFNMPSMTGADVTRLVRQMGCLTPIFGVTAASNMTEECLNAGMDDVILKPFTLATIAEKIRTTLLAPTSTSVEQK